MLIEKNRIVMRRPDDGHVHFRQRLVMGDLVRACAEACGIVVDMPNTDPPIRNGADIRVRRASFQDAIARTRPGLRPRFCAYMTPETTAETVDEVLDAGGDGFKIYPADKDRRPGTTNAQWGLHPSELLDDRRARIFDRMAERQAIWRGHCEHPDHKKGDREKAFLPILAKIVERHPGLRIVFEHISSAEGVAFVKAHPQMMATVTAHHMLLTWDDGYGDHDHCCMPCIKTEADRMAVFAFARDSPQAAYGSDSAPHPRIAKARVRGANGIFVPPCVGIPAVVGLFEREGCLETVEAFLSERYADWLGEPRNEGTITLVRDPWTVPDDIGWRLRMLKEFRPFLAGGTLEWRIAE